jgi:hypothetical protein
MAIVRDYRILRALERRGFIVCRDGRQRHWTGMRVRNYFVAEGPKLAAWWSEFEYKGKRYKLEYFDGCFHPFVVERGKPTPKFV